MTRRAIRGWYLVHKWTCLACTLFLLILCVTGLPLVFHDEIDAIGAPAQGAGPASATDAARLLPLDTMLAGALRARPGEVPLFMAFDDAGPAMTVTTGPRPDAAASAMTLRSYDRMSGRPIASGRSSAVTAWLLRLHTDLLIGLPGELFLGAMGLVFLVALVSGTVLYAPFMRRLAFGTLRRGRSPRLAWLDHHNLIGIAALGWMAVVGATGIVNSLVTPITRLWQATSLADMTRRYAGQLPVAPAAYASLDRAMATARAAVPGMAPQFIAFPGGAFSSRHHFAIFFHGATPLTRHLLTTALIDARTGALTDVQAMPWYFKALSLSRPLHFGDYGGLPMKLLWATLDLFTIAVLVSGLYLWLGRRRAPLEQRVREVESGGRLEPIAAA